MMSGNFRGFSSTFVARNIHVAAIFCNPVSSKDHSRQRSQSVGSKGGGEDWEMDVMMMCLERHAHVKAMEEHGGRPYGCLMQPELLSDFID